MADIDIELPPLAVLDIVPRGGRSRPPGKAVGPAEIGGGLGGGKLNPPPICPPGPGPGPGPGCEGEPGRGMGRPMEGAGVIEEELWCRA